MVVTNETDDDTRMKMGFYTYLQVPHRFAHEMKKTSYAEITLDKVLKIKEITRRKPV